MASKKLIAGLNKALADEIGSILQYLWQHWMVDGPYAPSFMEVFEKASRDEMRHMEIVGERIVVLGGDPTTQSSTVVKSRDAIQMVKDNLAAEKQAVQLYKELVKLADQEKDSATRHMLEGILLEEEAHLDLWQTMLGRMSPGTGES
ncbi:MAG: ferritin-like domain-containing protein [Planctomycetes bacterium]|nr:ferritin-like domain-containing protein [Planctomycetota bacterium]